MHTNSTVFPFKSENVGKLCNEEIIESWENLCRDTKCDELKWYAVRTYSCRERVVAQSFASQNICHYLPLLSEKRRWSDRIKTIQVPLFKNYIFVIIIPTPENFWKVIGTRGVTQILGGHNGPISIPNNEIKAVAHMLKNKIQLKVLCGFQRGQPVRIKAGPLRGMEGYFVRMKGQYHLAVNITILGQAVLTEVNYCDVEAR
ncbi:MAG: UpxY family transcription antiterminator [Planctomycetota bacterium]|jgi:transcription antitermination factor NusG